MPRLNRFHEAVRRAVARESALGEQLGNAKAVPFGTEQVENRTWRARWERANAQERKAMREAMASREDPMGVMATMEILGRARNGLAPLELAQEEQV